MPRIFVGLHANALVISLRKEDKVSMVSLSKSAPMDVTYFSSIFHLEILTTPSLFRPKYPCPFPDIFSAIQSSEHYFGLSFGFGLIIHFSGLILAFSP